jgi:hypothetical protein
VVAGLVTITDRSAINWHVRSPDCVGELGHGMLAGTHEHLLPAVAARQHAIG